WDILPWCLVLDMDSPTDERKNAPIRRAWMIFVGISELSWSLVDARLPNGIFGTNPLMTRELSKDLHEYVLPVLAPIFDAHGNQMTNPHKRMSFRALRLIGGVSIETACFGENGPDRKQRNTLATVDDLLEAIGDVWSAM